MSKVSAARANTYDVNSIALNGSSDAVLWICHYQTFLQHLQKVTIYIERYDIQLHFQKFMRAKNNYMAGHSLDITGVDILHIYGITRHVKPHFKNITSCEQQKLLADKRSFKLSHKESLNRLKALM